MKTQKDIRRRIKAVENIRKVTKAMETMSSIKYQKAVKLALSARAYSDELSIFISQILGTMRDEDLRFVPFTEARPVKNVVYVVFAADRGLCGIFNSRILHDAQNHAKTEEGKGRSVSFMAVGKKASDFFRRRSIKVISRPKDPKAVVAQCISLFEDKKADEIYLLFNRFYSASRSEVAAIRIFPVDFKSVEVNDHLPVEVSGLFGPIIMSGKYLMPEFAFEPEREKVLAPLIIRYIESTAHQVMLESSASENAARMVVMQQATSNANDMIRDLAVLYNKTRQAAITKELIEVVSCAEALK